MRRQFFSYVLPSVLAFALSGVYAIVDGFFVGNSMGDLGLAAISLAYPITAFLQAVGTGIGMGGAVQYSISKGRGNEHSQIRFFSGMTLLLLAVSFLSTLSLLFLARPVLGALGAEGEILELSEEYIRFIVYGAVFQIFGTGLVPMIRNTGSSLGAMIAMIAGFLTNIVLDYLFVWVLSMGMAGAAIATVIGQAVTMLICVALLVKKKMRLTLRFDGWFGQVLSEIVETGLPSFGLTFSPNITLILMNKCAILYGGNDAVSCYAVIAYITCIVQLLLQGVGDGSQPLVSLFYGERSYGKMKRIRRMTYAFSMVLAAVCMAVVFLTKGILPVFFGASPKITEMAAGALVYFIVGFWFVGFARTTTAYFYATQKNSYASLLIYAEPALLLLLLLTLPHGLGMTGVWLSVPVTQGCMAGIGAGLLRKKGKQRGE